MAPSECNEEWDKASLLHLSAAEKFQDITDCEKTHGPGQCRTSAWNGLNVFIPAMAGYMISRQIASGNVITRVSQPLYPTSDAGRACQPGFDPQLRPDCTQQSNRSTSSSSSSSSSSSRSSRRWFRTAAGAVIVNNGQTSTARGNTVVPRSSTQAPAVRTSVVSRGGFGATGRSMSSSS